MTTQHMQLLTGASPAWLTKVQVADANYTITGTHGRLVAYTSISAARVVNLPPASESGQTIQILDESGSCSHTNTITVTPDGSDAIEDGSTFILNYAYGSIRLQSSGSGKWVVIANPNLNLSAGVKTQPSLTDLGTGSITVGTGSYALYSNADGLGKITTHNLAGGTFALTDGVTNYVIADHTSTPTIRVTTDVTEINETTIIPIFTIYREGTTIHPFSWDQLGDALANKMHKSIVKTQRYRRESGLALGEAATRIVTLTAGTVWTGAVPTVMPAVRSDTGLMYMLYHNAGVWTKSAAITQYNNTNYDDGTNLQVLPGGKYAVNYIYRSVGADNELFLTLGTGAYSLGDAQASQPQSPPPLISSHAILVGRIIINQGGATAIQIDSSFVTLFTPTAATDHNSLASLQGGTASQYYHLTSAEYTGTGTGNFVRLNAPSTTGTWGFSGQINSTNTTLATSTTTGAIVTAGGIGCADSIWSGGNIVINAAAQFKIALPPGSATSGAWCEFGESANGIVYFGRDNSTATAFGSTAYGGVFYCGANVPLTFFTNATKRLTILNTGELNLTSTTDSTSTTTGSFVTPGGMGVAKSIVTGAQLYVYYSNAVATVGNGTGSATLMVDGGAGSTRSQRFFTNGSLRWSYSVNSVAESGSDAGSNFSIDAYTDGGVNIDSPITITRASGGGITLATARPVSMGRTTVNSVAGGANSGFTLTQVAENGTASSSYAPIDFRVPTTGLIGQFLSTANNYVNASVNLAANSTALLNYATSGQLMLAASGSSGIFTVNVGGVGTSTEWLRIIASGVATFNATTASTSTTTGGLITKGGFGCAGNVVIGGYLKEPVGANVASATTITPTGPIFHVTGTTAIATINLPFTGFTGTITLIPDGIFTTTTAGNIALASTAVVSRALTMTYDTGTSKWYPSY